MSPQELKKYTEQLNVEAKQLEEYMMDVSLYSDGVISFSDARNMPFKMIKDFEKRLYEKIKAKSGKNRTEYL